MILWFPNQKLWVTYPLYAIQSIFFRSRLRLEHTVERSLLIHIFHWSQWPFKGVKHRRWLSMRSINGLSTDFLTTGRIPRGTLSLHHLVYKFIFFSAGRTRFVILSRTMIVSFEWIEQRINRERARIGHYIPIVEICSPMDAIKEDQRDSNWRNEWEIRRGLRRYIECCNKHWHSIENLLEATVLIAKWSPPRSKGGIDGPFSSTSTAISWRSTH